MMTVKCNLGLKAHFHEDFLLNELKREADVHRILEKSLILCDKYSIRSFAYVILDPEHGYELRHPRDVFVPHFRQNIWLKALSGGHSQAASRGL